MLRPLVASVVDADFLLAGAYYYDAGGACPTPQGQQKNTQSESHCRVLVYRSSSLIQTKIVVM